MFKYAVSFLVVVLFLGGCAKPITYLGLSYPPTSHVDLFFDELDVKEDYIVMGRANIRERSPDADTLFLLGVGGADTEKMQADMIEKAREKGADGIIFGGLNQKQVVGSETTKEETKIEATFIKYKKNL